MGGGRRTGFLAGFPEHAAQELVDGRGDRGGFGLSDHERVEREDGDASGEALADASHEAEGLRSGQEPAPRAPLPVEVLLIPVMQIEDSMFVLHGERG